MANTYQEERREQILAQGRDAHLIERSREWMVLTHKYNYTYNFSWLGRPIIQFPQDMLAIQEIIWESKPDLIIETGIAHGGSLIFSASILEMIRGEGHVLGIDIHIRAPNRTAIEEHPMAKRITMLQGSSVAEAVLDNVTRFARSKKRVMVILDSDHTHEHVLKELQAYSKLVTRDCYLIVMDTSIEDAPSELFKNRPWRKGNSPKTAVWEFLKTNDRFEIDKQIDNKLLITVAPDGYLRCVK